MVMDKCLAAIYVIGRLGFYYPTSKREFWEDALETKGAAFTPKGDIENMAWSDPVRITEAEFRRI